MAKTSVISSEKASALLKDMYVSTVVGSRDRATITVMTYTFAKVSGVAAMKIENYYPQAKRWWVRLNEKTTVR